MCANFVTLMPIDIVINILARLELNDLRNLMLTCKSIYELIVNESTIWRLICAKRLIFQKMKSESISLSWYNKCRISYNWCKGIYSSKVIVKHRINYMPWLKLYNSQTWYLSVGSELRCYSFDRKEPNIRWSIQMPIKKRGDIRTNDISRFILKDNMIVCGNRDGCAAVYEINYRKQQPQLLFYIEDSHEDGSVEVSGVEKVKDIVITVSDNSPYVCFWECKDHNNSLGYLQCIRQCKIPKNMGCRCVAANDVEDKLALGLNGHSKPLLLDVHTGNFSMDLDVVKSCGQVIRDIQWHNGNLVAYVTHSGKLDLFDIRSSTVVYTTRDPFQSSLYCLKTDSNRAVLVGSSEYSRCVLFDLRSTHHVQMYFTQKRSSPIYSLDFDSTKLIAAIDRGVATLNFNDRAHLQQARDYSDTFEFVNR